MKPLNGDIYIFDSWMALMIGFIVTVEIELESINQTRSQECTRNICYCCLFSFCARELLWEDLQSSLTGKLGEFNITLPV